MNPDPRPRLTAAEYERWRDIALEEAQALRREALNDFWRGADAMVTSAAAAALRAARRLGQSLRRHSIARVAQE